MGIDRLVQTIESTINARVTELTRDVGIKYGQMTSDTAVLVDGKTYPVNPSDNLSNRPYGYTGMVKVMINNGRAVILG